MLFAPALAPAQQPKPASAAGLRIVVIAGEDAINIIQQKTAVNPIIEVRDRNNLPVSGVAVTFSVGGQGATFGGASALTVTTNAAGQAVVTGLTPTATGTITINATATVQGQALVATITQTNFATAQAAAQAAASAGGGSSGAATGGAAAGGGGGISATTIGIVGAAVGGGALVATRVVGSEDGTTYTGTFSGELFFPYSNCSRIHAMSGTLRIRLTLSDGGAVSGTAEIKGTDRVISGTCSNGVQAGATGGLNVDETAVTGSEASIAFRSERSNTYTADGRQGIHTATLVFSGSLNANVITGTLTHTEKDEVPGSGFPPAIGTSTYPITLR